MKEIPLTQGKVAIVDDEDYDWLSDFNWHAHKSAHNWYAAINVKKNGRFHQIFMHRIIMRCPRDKEIHHCNQKSLDNRKRNLEICDQKKNLSYRKYKK